MPVSSKTSKVGTSNATSKPGPTITASSQTTRFHVDTLTTPTKEIDLKQVNISIGVNSDLIVDAHLRLKDGVHYSLIGRNGEGKSTLLKAIVERIIPGIADNLRILLVGQVEDAPIDAEGEDDPTLTVTQQVVQSDKRRERYMNEYNSLTTAVDSPSAIDLSVALSNLHLDRSQYELTEAQKIAQRRSGARGADARKKLLEVEAQVKEAEERLEKAKLGELDPRNDQEKAAGLLAGIQDTLESMDAFATEARTRSILVGLGFSQEQLDAPIPTLSGGWRSRCSLASALVQMPDLLILDEPTNYLDISAVMWLQNFLSSFPSTLLVVAHDRDFLDAIAQETIVLRKKTLSYFEGNPSEREHQERLKRKGALKMQASLDRRREAMEKSIEDGRKSAKKTGDDNRARMAKSRQKKLDDRWGLERSAKGFRFKLQRDMGYYHTSNRHQIQIEDLDRPVTLPFPNPEPMRFPGSLISASKVSFKYPKSTTFTLENVTLTIHPGTRLALVGKNGQGKSTLVKLLIGTFQPSKGTIERHPRLRFGYFDQHSVEVLSSTTEISRRSSLEHLILELKRVNGIDMDEGTGRSFLGSFGLQGAKATNPIASLSGGQKVRLALALIVYPSPDLLVLDEVTTHLDSDTIIGLMKALRAYTGAILLVSHDRHFIRCAIEGAPLLPPSAMIDLDEQGEYGDDADGDEGEDEDSEEEGSGKKGEVYSVGPKGVVKLLEGGVDEYVSKIERRLKKLEVQR